MNRAQKRQVQAYLHFRDKRMSVVALIRFNRRIFLLTAAIGLASVAGMLYLRDPFLAWLFGVAYGAVILRDIAQCVRWCRTWSITKELLDWEKVERFASGHGLAAPFN